MEILPVGQQPVLVENGQKVSAPQVREPETVPKGVGERADSYSISNEAQSLNADEATEVALQKAEQVEAAQLEEEQSKVYANEQAQAETITPMIGEMTLEEANQLKRMESKADKVVAHESAHALVGGTLMLGGPAYQYEVAPNGETYEVSGQSRIDMSPVAGNPQATVAKMQQVKRAALAPLNPSGADRVVASQADQLENRARKVMKEKADKILEQNLIGIGGESNHAVQEQAHAEWRAKRSAALKKYDYMGDGVPSEAARDDALKGYVRVKPVNRPSELQEEALKKTKA
jgi:hypothetical protein